MRKSAVVKDSVGWWVALASTVESRREIVVNVTAIIWFHVWADIPKLDYLFCNGNRKKEAIQYWLFFTSSHRSTLLVSSWDLRAAQSRDFKRRQVQRFQSLVKAPWETRIRYVRRSLHCSKDATLYSRLLIICISYSSGGRAEERRWS